MFWAPIQDVDEVIADPQAWAAGGFVDVPTPDGSTTTMIATPVDFGGVPCEPRSLAPDLGEHTRAILTELGRTEAAIDALYANGSAQTHKWFGEPS
jgi:crotonobetainyl-CoA:carnitine CoA-transferase CaiB-like acyl-CoA transferase